MAARIALYVFGALVLAPMFVGILGSVLADLGMLVDAYGVLGVAIFLSPTAAILAWSAFH